MGLGGNPKVLSTDQSFNYTESHIVSRLIIGSNLVLDFLKLLPGQLLWSSFVSQCKFQLITWLYATESSVLTWTTGKKLDKDMKRAPSIGTPSIYSHTTTRSNGVRSSRSTKTLHVPWYKRPIIPSYLGADIQRLSLSVAVYALCLSMFTMGTAAFDLYCLEQTAVGSYHSGYYLISFDFVYVGNKHVRSVLITIAFFSLLGGLVLMITSIILVKALVKEYEKKMVPWLICMLVFSAFRLVSFLFVAVVNDMIFAYNILMCLLWLIFTFINVLGWAIVYTLYLELADLTKLEDLAQMRMGTMTSLATQSMAGSRPTTPHSTTSTVPLP
ncbi:unnamed protein product [Allacma fusca]|uniref:Uncharacterized protein n=1 Tax=Allacma fusca TaxID=39272 RepID=A0A8J2J8W8_9HEXA|nr:unnamed protein product [Allacma fusca]